MVDNPASSDQNPNGNQSTKQLLDELDALMERMLALPVQECNSEGEDEPAPEPEPVEQRQAPRNVSLVPAPAATMTVQAPRSAESAPVVVAGEIPAFWPTPTQAKPSSKSQSAPQPQAAPKFFPLGTEPPAPIRIKRYEKTPSQREQVLPITTPVTGMPRKEPLPTPRPAWLKTPAPTAPVPEPGSIMKWLLAVNSPFDNCTMALGFVGRWLRGEQGRSLIGWSGVTMLAIAAIWVLLLFYG